MERKIDMKNSILASWLVALLGFTLAASAQAYSVVNTGAPNGQMLPLLLDSSHWLAAEFSVSQTTQIDSIEGYMQVDPNGNSVAGNPTSDTFTIALYNNLAAAGKLDRPNYNGGAIASQQAQLTADNSWNGLTGLASSSSWTVGPGTYWVAFEVQQSDTLGGFMPVFASHLPRAWYDGSSVGGYTAVVGASSAYDFGVSVTAVPLPSALVMVVPALGLLGRFARRTSVPA